MNFVEVEGAVEQIAPDLAAAGVRLLKVENDDLGTPEKCLSGGKRLEILSRTFDERVASTVLPLMDQGLSNAEIQEQVGNLRAIGTLRRQWEGEARRNRAHAKVTAGPPRQRNSVDGARLLQDVHEFVGRFVAYPSEAAHVAHTLWLAIATPWKRGRALLVWRFFLLSQAVARRGRSKRRSFLCRTPLRPSTSRPPISFAR